MVTFVLRKHPPACALRGLRCWDITNWCDGRGARHRSAKPATAVRFRFAPQKQGRLCADLLFLRCELFRIHFHIPPHTPPLPKEGLSIGGATEYAFLGGGLCADLVFEMRGRTSYITHPLNPPPLRGTYYFRALVASLSFLRCESFRIHFHIPPHTPPLRQQVVVFLKGSCKPPLIESCSKDFINYIA